MINQRGGTVGDNGLIRVRMLTKGAGPKGCWKALDLRWVSTDEAGPMIEGHYAELVDLPTPDRKSADRYPVPSNVGGGGARDWQNLTDAALKAVRKPGGVMLETGTANGDLIRALVNVAKKTGCWLYSVDSNEAETHGIDLRENPELTVVTADPIEWILNYKGKLSFAFLDSSHNREHILAELKALEGKVKTVAVHNIDHRSHGNGIRLALEEFGHEYEELRGECGIAVVDMTKENDGENAGENDGVN